MNWPVFALIILSVALSAMAQIALKAGMSSHSVAYAMKLGTPLETAIQIAINPWVIGGLGLYFTGAMVWLVVLAKVDVSMAYPFVGLGFILTMIMANLLIGEEITTSRLAGTILIVLGVAVISRG